MSNIASFEFNIKNFFNSIIIYYFKKIITSLSDFNIAIINHNFINIKSRSIYYFENSSIFTY